MSNPIVDGIEIKCNYTKLVPIETLVEHPRNRNRHSIEQIERLAKIIKARGWRESVVLSKKSGFVVCGNGRKQVAEYLKMSQVPVDEQDFKNEAEEIQHMNAHNEIARWAELDVHGLITDIKELKLDEQEDFDFDDLGLKFDLNSMLEDVDLPNVDNEIKEKKYIVEVELPNDMEQQDLYDDLISKGFMAKIK
jgi:ParB-like chromosome segregation protein Spo0J